MSSNQGNRRGASSRFNPQPFTVAGSGEGKVVFAPLAAADLAAMTDALAWHAKRLGRLRDGEKRVRGVVVTESEGYRARAEKVEELLWKVGEWWKMLGGA